MPCKSVSGSTPTTDRFQLSTSPDQIHLPMDVNLVRQLTLQFLVHSFLYYELGESLISDQHYDKICSELKKICKSSTEISVPYWDIVQQIGEEASGFFIKKYPPAIISNAMHLLYQENYAKRIDFDEFISRFGYRRESLAESQE